MEDLELRFAIAKTAKQFNVSTLKAAQIYLDFIKHKKQELERELVEQIGNEAIEQLRSPVPRQPTTQELIFTYNKLKFNNELIPARLIEDWTICVESCNAIENKLFPAGTPCEIVKSWLGGSILEIWIGEDCCTYVESKAVKLL